MLRPRLSPTRSLIRPTTLVLGRICTDSIAAQRTSREPCLVIRPRCTVLVGLVVHWVNPAQQVNSSRSGEAVHVADLGDQDGGEGGTDPGNGLHRGIAGSLARRCWASLVNTSISKSRVSITRRSEVIRAAAAGSPEVDARTGEDEGCTILVGVLRQVPVCIWPCADSCCLGSLVRERAPAGTSRLARRLGCLRGAERQLVDVG